MLQQLESAYLAILRFVVIFVAGILLVAVVITGFNSLKTFQSEPKKELSPKVSEQDLINGVLTKPSTPQNVTQERVNEVKQEQTDPNIEAYKRATNSITVFINKSPRLANRKILTQNDIINALKQSTYSVCMGDSKLVSMFANNFADSIDKTLKDQSVINEAMKFHDQQANINIVGRALGIFTQNFKKQIDDQNLEHMRKLQESQQKKIEGIESLKMAGMAFGAFLLIVFLSVIIKIERNLRPAEKKSE